MNDILISSMFTSGAFLQRRPYTIYAFYTIVDFSFWIGRSLRFLRWGNEIGQLKSAEQTWNETDNRARVRVSFSYEKRNF